jgi:ABC-type nitrate/sulfonate/bicarbonate transport system substrate-binding protein
MTPGRVAGMICALVTVAGLAASLVACGGATPEQSDPSVRPVSLQLNWFHEAEFLGYYVADAQGFYRDNGLDVQIREGGPGKPAIDSALDGSADFAISSFGETRDAVVKREPIVAVMAGFQIPPLVIFSLADAGITKPADLAGRRVGVTTDYWRDVLDQTLMAANVKPSSVRKVAVRPEDLAALYDGKVDAWLGYAQDEPIKAEVAGHPVTTIFPADYGVGGYEGLLLVGKPVTRRDPDLVRRFVQASQRGWRYAVEHPDEAAGILLKWAPDAGLDFQKAAVRAVGPLVDAPQVPIGWIDAQRWRALMGEAFDPADPGYTMRFASSER